MAELVGTIVTLVPDKLDIALDVSLAVPPLDMRARCWSRPPEVYQQSLHNVTLFSLAQVLRHSLTCVLRKVPMTQPPRVNTALLGARNRTSLVWSELQGSFEMLREHRTNGRGRETVAKLFLEVRLMSLLHTPSLYTLRDHGNCYLLAIAATHHAQH